MIRIVIVDDEPLARARLRHLIAGLADCELIGECGDGAAAIEAIDVLGPDLVLLDIEMPEVSGLEVLEQIGPADMPLTIFVTAYDRYAVAAFERCALDYLLKPVEPERLQQAVSRARTTLAQREVFAVRERFATLLQGDASTPPYLDRLLVRRDESLLFIRVAEIDRIESVGNYVAIHAGGQKFVHRGTLNAFEERLDPRRFVRTHRAHMVQIDRVREIETTFGRYNVILRDGTEVPLSRRYRQKLDRFAPPSGAAS